MIAYGRYAVDMPCRWLVFIVYSLSSVTFIAIKVLIVWDFHFMRKWENPLGHTWDAVHSKRSDRILSTIINNILIKKYSTGLLFLPIGRTGILRQWYSLRQNLQEQYLVWEKALFGRRTRHRCLEPIRNQSDRSYYQSKPEKNINRPYSLRGTFLDEVNTLH